MAYQDFLLDKRVTQRHLDKGILDPKLVEKALAALPDRSANIAPPTSADEAPEADGDED